MTHQLWLWISHLSTHDLLDLFTRSVSICAVLHTVLPPWDWHWEFVDNGLSEFPALQKAFYFPFHNRYYRLLIYVIGYIALHARSTVWHTLSIGNPKSVNYANGKTPITKSEQESNISSDSGKVG